MLYFKEKNKQTASKERVVHLGTFVCYWTVTNMGLVGLGECMTLFPATAKIGKNKPRASAVCHKLQKHPLVLAGFTQYTLRAKHWFYYFISFDPVY